MKLVYLGIIMASLLIAMSYAKPVHADSTDPVQILDVQVESSTLKVNDTFLISATILNSSPYPIYLTSGSCTPAFSVSFDIHAKHIYPNIACTSEAIQQKVEPQGEITISNANKPGTIYQAVLSGTANANITIPYSAKNQTAADYSNIDYSISKSFQFVIHGSNETLQKTPAYFLPPLQQIRAGALTQNVKCSANFNLIIKSEDRTPACVKPDTAGILVERGWGIIPLAGLPTNHNNSIDKSSGIVSIGNQTTQGLTLFLSTDSKSMNPPEPLVVDISLNNTSSKSLTLTRSDNWSRSDLNLGPCSTLPFGISILKGYYTEQNMTGARSLVLYQNIPCPGPLLIKSYTFQPLSSKATQVCDTLFSCTGLVDMKTHLEINGFIDNSNQHQPFKVGTYTIIAGDEWGHVIIRHFTEAYAVAYDNSNLKGS